MTRAVPGVVRLTDDAGRVVHLLPAAAIGDPRRGVLVVYEGKGAVFLGRRPRLFELVSAGFGLEMARRLMGVFQESAWADEGAALPLLADRTVRGGDDVPE